MPALHVVHHNSDTRSGCITAASCTTAASSGALVPSIRIITHCQNQLGVRVHLHSTLQASCSQAHSQRWLAEAHSMCSNACYATLFVCGTEAKPCAQRAQCGSMRLHVYVTRWLHMLRDCAPSLVLCSTTRQASPLWHDMAPCHSRKSL
jgi:hypothetical protein